MTTQLCTSPINIALLRQVQEEILAAPTQFHMGEWHIGDIWPGAQDKCSGSACLAGWAVVLSCRVRLSLLSNVEIERLARQALGLNEDKAKCLFLLSLWPWEFQEPYIFAPRTLADYEANARLTAQRIEVFIATRC